MTVVTGQADRPLVEMGVGVQRRTMVWGDRALLAEIYLQPGGVVPRHDHSYEQTGYCFEGKFDFDIDGDVHRISAGMSWSVPGGVPHAATALTKSFLIEVWTPARDDYKD